MTSIKALAQSGNLNFVPSDYAYTANHHHEPTASDLEDSIPTIDFSLLTNGNPDQRSKIIQDIGKACEDWGFFLLINHGVPESLTKTVMDAAIEFFDLTEEEKREYEGKGVLDPIRYGTSFHSAGKGRVLVWRDYIKVISHPEFHFPNKPKGFSEVALEFCKKGQSVAKELIKAISESLGLEESYLDKAMNLDSGLQLFAVNLYPPCPQPDLAIGIPPHTDHGLVTLLMENGVGGNQIQHKGKWVSVKALPNSFLVNTADQLEIFTNGKYKSVTHRAIVNSKVTRISIPLPHGPSLDTIVAPNSKFVDPETNPAAYKPLTYREYIDLQQNSALGGKMPLDQVRVTGE